MSRTTEFLERNWMPIALTAAGAYFIWRFFGKGKSAEQTAAIQSAVVQLESQTGIRASYHEAQYIEFGDTLYSAMFSSGTNEVAIFSIMQRMNNDIDVLKTIEAFGERRPDFTEAWALTKWNLRTYINEDMSKDDVARINQMFASKGITYRF